jgi:hypothetical protein
MDSRGPLSFPSVIAFPGASPLAGEAPPSTTTDELLAALRLLGRGVQVSFSVDAEDLARALERRRDGGRLKMLYSTAEAASIFGFRPKYWRNLCAGGKMDGAWQEGGEGGDWRMPTTAIVAHLQRIGGSAAIAHLGNGGKDETNERAGRHRRQRRGWHASDAGQEGS